MDPESRAHRAGCSRKQHANIFENAYRGIGPARARQRRSFVRSALEQRPPILARRSRRRAWLGQLRMVARLIPAAGALGQRRQIFFCSVGGYDTHGNQSPTTPTC